MQIEVIGAVPKEFIEFIKVALIEFFGSINIEPEYIEIYVYEISKYKLDNLTKDAIISGVLAVETMLFLTRHGSDGLEYTLTTRNVSILT